MLNWWATEDITEIFKLNTLDKYFDRQDKGIENGMLKEISNIYYSEFFS